MSEFAQNVVVITGASAGIGKEIAFQLADQGARLALAARDAAKLEEVAETCRQRGGEAMVIPTDVAEEDQCRNLIEQTIAHYGRLDTLINNAGITQWCYFHEIERLDFMKQIMRVNYYGSVYCTHYALPYLLKSNGRLVGVASLTGITGVPTRSFYAASKHAMMGFFDSLRIELMDTGVTVTMICPGFVNTEVRQRGFGPDGKPLGKSNVQDNKIMTAEECARISIRAIASRKREEIMTLKGKLGRFLKFLVPGLIDKIARKTIEQGR